MRERTERPAAASKSDNGGYWAALALVLGLLVPVLGLTMSH